MANPEHLAILKQGVEEWNQWRQAYPAVDVELSQANLIERNLQGANLKAADLSRADLSGANLRDADLSFTRLIAANLARADATGTNLVRTNTIFGNITQTKLSRAILRGADLRWARLTSAELQDADLSQAIAGATLFSDLDLSRAQNLHTVQHFSPSTIGIDTIYKSQGRVAERFLRGCGVPDEFIAYIGSMVGRPIEFYSCFISYSTKDQDFADRLYADLQNKGVRCWFAPHDIKGGEKVHEQLDEAIRLHDKLLLILSEHSMKSPWVKTELLRSQKREIEENKRPTLSSNHPNESNGGARWGPRQDDDKDGAPTRKKKQILFPITLVPYAALENWEYPISTGIDLAEEMRQYFIPDFSNWKDHDSYQKAFQRLVKDLKAE